MSTAPPTVPLVVPQAHTLSDRQLTELRDAKCTYRAVNSILAWVERAETAQARRARVRGDAVPQSLEGRPNSLPSCVLSALHRTLVARASQSPDLSFQCTPFYCFVPQIAIDHRR